jgi:hypothetical protein
MRCCVLLLAVVLLGCINHDIDPGRIPDGVDYYNVQGRSLHTIKILQGDYPCSYYKWDNCETDRPLYNQHPGVNCCSLVEQRFFKIKERALEEVPSRQTIADIPKYYYVVDDWRRKEG